MTPNIGEDNSTTSSKALDAIELRIGSFYNHVKAGVIKLEADWISYFAKYPELLSGLPLNEEWLLRFGFEPNGVYKSMRLALDPLHNYGTRTFVVVANNNKAWIELISKNVHKQYTEKQSMSFKCGYVHQLQNLYYALTNSELTLKEKVI
jgi:hypothetical protein